MRFRSICVLAAALLLGGCAQINTYLTDKMSNLPEWAGGMPPDAPPRPSDPRYAQYMAEHGHALTAEDAAKAPAATKTSAPAQTPAPVAPTPQPSEPAAPSGLY